MKNSKHSEQLLAYQIWSRLTLHLYLILTNKNVFISINKSYRDRYKWWTSSNFAPASSNEFLDIQETIEYGFTLKRVRDMIRRCSQMHRTDKYSQHSSIIWPVWLKGWVFIYELSGCGFESSCSDLNFRFRACFE